MAEYSSLKVPELKKLLSEKGLPQTGNKADLVARLTEHDKSAGDAAPAAAPAAKKDDEITYSDDEAPKAAAPAETKPAEPAPAAEAKQDEQPAPAEPAAAAPAESSAPAADAPAAEDKEPAAPAVSYAAGLASTAADEEAKKRAERAKRFGIEEDDEAKRRAERAKRFGIDEKELASGLDSALPERSLKRGRGAEAGGNRPGKRQSLDRRGGRDGGRRRNGGGGGGKPAGILDDPVEKAKAEKRAARFAAA